MAGLLVLVDDFAAVHPSRAAWLLGGMAGIAYARPWQRGGGAYARHMRSLCGAWAAAWIEPWRRITCAASCAHNAAKANGAYVTAQTPTTTEATLLRT